MDQFHLNVSSHPENLQKIRKMVTDALDKAACKGNEAAGIVLSVDETCSNIIRHAYQNDYTRRFDVFITVQNQCLTIRITDCGPPFDIKAAEPRDTGRIEPGGLGIHIIKEVMDKVEYCRTDDGMNQVTLIKNL